MSLKSLLKIAEDYLRKHPAPASAQIFKGLLKLGYSYSAPATNSKSKKQLLYPLQNFNPNSTFLQPLTPTLAFDEKANKLEYNNNFDSISTQQAHDKVIQDHIFGSAKLNKNKDKWIYAAKKKTPKSKSYFLGGSGKPVYVHDLGQLYDDITEVGIFIWDLKLKKIFPIQIQITGQTSKYALSTPIFANDQGTKFICHGYKRTQFGYGISHCFNRPIQIFQVSIENFGEQNSKTVSKKLITKHETNMFANISPCYNYIIYFGGSDYLHSYYLDIVVIKRKQGNQEYVQNEGYDKQWKQIHRIKQGFVGSYITTRTETFIRQNQPYAYFQTVQKAEQRIKCMNLQTGQIKLITQNKPGQSYAISGFNREQKLLVGNVTSHASNGFFYLNIDDNKVVQIPQLARQEFILEEFKDPIHGYYLQSKDIAQQFKKQKKPLLVLVHGGPHGFADPCLTLFKYMLLKCGYAIIMPNFSGSTGFGPEFLKGAHGNIGKTDAQQIVKLVQNVLASKQYIDREKVYVYGGSYGGYMAAIMGSRYSKYFKAAVILNGVLSVPANFWFSDIPEWSTAESLKQAKIHGLTAQDYVRMFQQSPISQPMKIPTLQFLGAKDRRVPYRQGLLFQGMTKKVGVSIQTYVYQNAAHSLADCIQTSIDVVMKSILFLEGLPLKQDKPVEPKKQQKSQPQKKQQSKPQQPQAQSKPQPQSIVQENEPQK